VLSTSAAAHSILEANLFAPGEPGDCRCERDTDNARLSPQARDEVGLPRAQQIAVNFSGRQIDFGSGDNYGISREAGAHHLHADDSRRDEYRDRQHGDRNRHLRHDQRRPRCAKSGASAAM